MSWKRLAAGLVERQGLVEQKFRKPAGGEPGETAIVSQTPESKSPVTFKSMPAKESRFGAGSGHRLDRVFHDLTNPSDLDHGGVTIRQSPASPEQKIPGF